MADGVEVVDAPVSIAKAPDPVRAVRSTPEASIVQAARAVAAGDADALVCGGSTGPALAAGLFNIKRATGIHRPALAIPVPGPRAPGHAARRRRQRRGAPRAPRPVRLHGRRASRRRARHRAPARRPAVERRGGQQGHAAGGRGPRRAARPHGRGRHLRLRRQRRGQRGHRGQGRRGRHRRLHRQRRAEADGGRLGGDAAPIRDAAMSSRARQGRRRCCCARRCASCARRSIPRAPAARTCSGCAGSAWCRTGASAAAASRRRSCWPRAAVRGRRRRAARTPRWRPPHALRAGPAVRIALYALPRHDPRRGLQPHPGAPGRRARARSRAIDESTRFKEDLEADSLDLYTLVQELEDSYGVRMSDEQAARILTVGQAVDFVLAHAPSHVLSPGPSPRIARESCRTTCASRSSRTPPGPSGAPTPTRAWPSSATPCSAWRSPRTSIRAWRPSATAPGG